MKILLRILITTIIVVFISHFMKGVHVASFTTALFVALVLGLLNVFIKPIFIFFTLPITVLTLGLFLLFINAIMIELCSVIVGGFSVDTFFTAFLFSVILSVSQSILYTLFAK